MPQWDILVVLLNIQMTNKITRYFFSSVWVSHVFKNQRCTPFLRCYHEKHINPKVMCFKRSNLSNLVKAELPVEASQVAGQSWDDDDYQYLKDFARS